MFVLFLFLFLVLFCAFVVCPSLLSSGAAARPSLLSRALSALPWAPCGRLRALSLPVGPRRPPVARRPSPSPPPSPPPSPSAVPSLSCLRLAPLLSWPRAAAAPTGYISSPAACTVPLYFWPGLQESSLRGVFHGSVNTANMASIRLALGRTGARCTASSPTLTSQRLRHSGGCTRGGLKFNGLRQKVLNSFSNSMVCSRTC